MQNKNKLLLIIFSLLPLFVHTQNSTVYFYLNIDSIYNYNLNLFQKINIYDIDKLNLNDCNLSEVENNINTIDFDTYYKQLDNNNKAETELFQKVSQLKLSICQSRIILNQFLINSDYWFYKSAIEKLNINDTITACSLLEQALHFNMLHIPSLFTLSSILLNQDKLKETTQLLKSFSTGISSNQLNDVYFLNSLQLLCQQIKSKAQKYYADGNYHESLNVFLFADTICQQYNLPDIYIMKEGIINSINGIYQSFIKVANQAYNTQNYSISETYTDKAFEYASKNRSAIPYNNETDNLYSKIYYRYLDISMKYKQNFNKTQSEIYSKKADTVCLKITNYNCSKLVKNDSDKTKENSIQINSDTRKENITSNISDSNDLIVQKNIIKASIPKNNSNLALINKNKRTNSLYNDNTIKNLMTEGNIYFEKALYDKALTSYQNAQSIYTKQFNKNNFQFDSIIHICKQKIVLTPLQNIDFIIWSNNFDEAEKKLNECKKLQNIYGLETDVVIADKLTETENKVNTKFCESKQNIIDIQTDKLRTYLNLQEYNYMLNLLNDIYNIKKQYSNCLLLTLEADDIYNKNRNIFNFYNYKEKALEKFNEQNFKEFAENYQKADSIFSILKTDNRNIKHNQLIDFLSFNYNTDACITVLQYEIDNKNHKVSIELLNLLREHKYPSDKTNNYQLSLAKLLDSMQDYNNKENLLKDFPFLQTEKKWYKVFLSKL